MKFGKLLARELQAVDATGWPSVRYKDLKSHIKGRAGDNVQLSLFQTGTFKRALRDDLVSAPHPPRRARVQFLRKNQISHE